MSEMGSSGGGFSDVLKLDFGGVHFHGRSEELKTLVDAYHRIRLGPSEIVMVQGYSGTGKSTLVNEFKSHLKGGNFCSGKFQQLHHANPFAAVASAFDQVSNALVGSQEQQEVVDKIQESIGATEISVLAKVVPRLWQLLSDTGDNNELDVKEQVGKAEALNHLNFAFRSFVRALCSPEHPLVLFLDDLQWADVASLDLIKFIVTDSKLKSFLFVGSYRDNEVTNAVHPLARHLSNVEKEKNVTRIQLGNLSKKAVNQLISDLTKLDTDNARPLTDVVYQKTLGNVFFVLRFLDHMQQEKILYYSLSTYKWTWDMDRIQSETDISINVVELIASKIQRLPDDVESVMKVASCLWSTFDADLLSFLVLNLGVCNVSVKDKQDVLGILQQAALEGLVEQKGAGRYKFSHDRIQQAAYSLVPQGRERELLHLRIGEQLQHYKSDEQSSIVSSDWVCFVTTDQLDRGSAYITDSNKRVELARLNLTAAEYGINMSAYVPAAEYLKSGIELLDKDRKWTEHYDLSLNLTQTAAEVAYGNGEFEVNKSMVMDVLDHAHCSHDKLRAQTSYVQALAAQQRFKEAMDFGLLILGELGERFPKKATSLHVVASMVRTNLLLKGLSDEDILALPLLKDDDKIAAI